MRRYFILAIALIVVLGATALYSGYVRFITPGPLKSDVTLVVPEGTGVAAIARQLEATGVIKDAFIFRFGVRLSGADKTLRAGEYLFPPETSARTAMLILRGGETVVRRLTVPEGLTVAQILPLLKTADGLFEQMPAPPAEGTLLPETYHYGWGDTRRELIARMQGDMTETLAGLWAARSPGLPLASPAEAVTLASIVEKETGVAAERPRVAAVFINRLRKGMRLQSDPTVIYALSGGEGEMDRELTRQDLKVISPYNTYINAGLPPGPISNPGRESLQAVLNPMETDELYFVADGSGGHVFAKTLAEHNRNAAKWRKIRDGKSTGN